MLVLTVFVLIIDWGVTIIEERLLVWRPKAATHNA
jgi:NitT/TauT family transport system permease protein